MAESHLPLLFPVPDNYRREFHFQDVESGVHSKMVIHSAGIDMVDIEVPDPAGSRVASRMLDWIEDSIVMVRKEVGDL